MKRFRDIIQDTRAPSTSDLWINNGELKYYMLHKSSWLKQVSLLKYVEG